VAPIGHLEAPRTPLDRELLAHANVGAAAGAPDAVFAVAPAELARATGAEAAVLAAQGG